MGCSFHFSRRWRVCGRWPLNEIAVSKASAKLKVEFLALACLALFVVGSECLAGRWLSDACQLIKKNPKQKRFPTSTPKQFDIIVYACVSIETFIMSLPKSNSGSSSQ